MLVEELEILNKIRTIKEQEMNNELQKARRALISVSCVEHVLQA